MYSMYVKYVGKYILDIYFYQVIKIEKLNIWCSHYHLYTNNKPADKSR